MVSSLIFQKYSVISKLVQTQKSCGFPRPLAILQLGRTATLEGLQIAILPKVVISQWFHGRKMKKLKKSARVELWRQIIPLVVSALVMPKGSKKPTGASQEDKAIQKMGNPNEPWRSWENHPWGIVHCQVWFWMVCPNLVNTKNSDSPWNRDIHGYPTFRITRTKLLGEYPNGKPPCKKDGKYRICFD